MKKIITIIGARPQFIKASAISKAIRTQFASELEEILLHTGQHYDNNMSQVFFDELEIPAPKYNLNIGSGGHGAQTAAMLSGIEEILVAEKPNALLVYGDTNSTLAGAIAASKIHIPVVHVEAGIRSFNKKMPEEINRIMCDHLSTLLFSPADSGIANLTKEGFIHNPNLPVSSDNPKVFRCGDVMLDVALNALKKAQELSLADLGVCLHNDKFVLCTIHRDSNTDHAERLNNILKAILDVSETEKVDVIIPLHPRTKKMMATHLNDENKKRLAAASQIKIIDPTGYLHTQYLLSNCALVMTDSGGLQKEAYFCQKPVVVLRTETEWVELIAGGHAAVCDDNGQLILATAKKMLHNPPAQWPNYYGDGKASEFICAKILELI
jgi:UDP-GlcNAc3NAcA epimerase